MKWNQTQKWATTSMDPGLDREMESRPAGLDVSGWGGCDGANGTKDDQSKISHSEWKSHNSASICANNQCDRTRDR